MYSYYANVQLAPVKSGTQRPAYLKVTHLPACLPALLLPLATCHPHAYYNFTRHKAQTRAYVATII